MKKFDGVLLASDYDGTLYDENGVITPVVREAISYFISEGGKFTVCTGRTFQGFKAYESSYINSPVILANGAMIYDYEKNEIVHASYIYEDIIEPLKGLINDFPDLSVEMYPFGKTFCVNPSLASVNHFRCQGIEFKSISDPSRCLFPIVKAMSYAFDYSAEVQKRLTEQYPQLHYLPTPGSFIEIMQRGTDKGSGIMKLAESLGISPENVYAVGDGYNDVDMLTAAKIGFVPENGSEEAKSVAGRIVKPNTDNAVANVIEILDEIYHGGF